MPAAAGHAAGRKGHPAVCGAGRPVAESAEAHPGHCHHRCVAWLPIPVAKLQLECGLLAYYETHWQAVVILGVLFHRW